MDCNVHTSVVLTGSGCFKQPPECNVGNSGMNLNEAVNVAFRLRTSIKAAQFNIHELRESEGAAIAPYLPSMSLASLVTHVNRTRISSIDPKHNVAFTLRQLIWDFGATIDLYRAAQRETHIAILEEILEKDSVQFETESSFLDLLATIEQKASIDALDQSSQAEIDRSSHQQKIGLLNQQEWLSALVQYEQSLSDVKRYSDELNTAHSELQRAMGVEIESPQKSCLSLSNDFLQTPNLFSVQWYHDQALANRKEIKIKDEEILREKYLKLNEQKAYAPRFAYFTRITRDAFRGGSSVTPWRTGLEITWEFDGFASAKRASATNYRIKKLKMLKTDTVQQVKLEVDKAYYKVNTFLKHIPTEYAAYFRSFDQFELSKKEFEIGKLAETDFIQAQTDWELARFRFIKFKINVTLAYRELLFVTGYPCQITKRLN